jgi:hypothetical protein
MLFGAFLGKKKTIMLLDNYFSIDMLYFFCINGRKMNSI